MTDTKKVLFGGMLACAISLGLGRFAFTPILPVMQAENGMGAELGGWLAAANNVGYLIGAVWAGTITTEVARRRLLAMGLVALVVSLAAMAVGADMMGWCLLRIAAGVASGWVFVLAAALVLPCLAQSGHARLSGLHFGGVGLGVALSGLLIGHLAQSWGSQTAWLGTAALASIMAFLAWPGLAAAHSRQGAAAVPAAHGLPASCPFPVPLLAASYFCAGLGYIVTGTFLVAMVRHNPALSSYANLSWVVVGLAAIPSTAAWSWLAEHRGHRHALMAAHVMEAVGVALPGLSDHPAIVLLGAVLFGSTFLGIVGMALAFGRVLTPHKATRTIGMLTAAFGIGQIIGPPLGAWLAASGGWNRALFMASGVLMLGWAMLAAGGRTCGSPLPQPDTGRNR
jgi:MFS family permease